MTQPTISIGISRLEKEMNTQLIRREPNGITFTPECELLIPHIQRILSENEALCSEMGRLAQAASQTLRMGISPTLGGKLLPLLYTEFVPRWPGAKIHFFEGGMEDHVGRLRQGAIDISYNALPDAESGEGLRTHKITTAEICAIMNPTHPLAKLKTIPIELLEGMELVLLNENARIRKLVDKALQSKDISCRIVSSHEQISSMLNMVHLLNAVGFINADTIGIDDSTSRFAVRPMAEPLRFDVGLIAREEHKLSPIARELIRFIKEHREEL